MYIRRLTPQIARGQLERLTEDVPNLFFAWAGAAERGQGHYYRIQGHIFMVEYDNVQNDANHIYTVWRDLGNDFGQNLLKRHYQSEH